MDHFLSIKSNDYHEELITEVVFNFFKIDPARESYYTSKWQDFSALKPEVKLGKFNNNLKLPNNPYYLNRGEVFVSKEDLKIISSDLGTFIVSLPSTVAILSDPITKSIFKENAKILLVKDRK